MQHGGKLSTRPFCVPLFINKEYTWEHILQINHKLGFRTKDVNKDNNKSASVTPRDKFQRHQQKFNSVRFNDPYDAINKRDNKNEPTLIMNAADEHLHEE